jgi:hypothetical protein
MANVLVYGCVDWTTGDVEFDTECSKCADYTGCMVRDGGAHTGQVAVSVTTCGCSDTYYACVDWAGGGAKPGDFELLIPDSCIGFANSYEGSPGGQIDLACGYFVDCENCVAGALGDSYKFFGVDDYLNGNTFDVENQGEEATYCYWMNEYAISAPDGITIRRWTTSDCTGGYTDYSSTTMTFRLRRYAASLALEICIRSILGFVWYPVFFNNNENDCCFQTLTTELGCGDSSGALCDNPAVCEDGQVAIQYYY